LGPEQRRIATGQIDSYLSDLEVEGSLWIAATTNEVLIANASLDDTLAALGPRVELENILLKFVSSEVWQ
jgi:hypothetical protein